MYMGRYTCLTCATCADSRKALPSHPYFLGKSPTQVDNGHIRGDSLFYRNVDVKLSVHPQAAVATRLRTSPCPGGFHTVQCTVPTDGARAIHKQIGPEAENDSDEVRCCSSHTGSKEKWKLRLGRSIIHLCNGFTHLCKVSWSAP